MSYPITLIAKIIQAKAVLKDSYAVVEDLLTDSRKLLLPNTTLFFALPGQGRHGNHFIEALTEKNVKSFVVQTGYSIPTQLQNNNFLYVDDVLSALQILAAYHRQQFQLPVIGITGSNGKTIVKEWLYQLLSSTENIVKSPKSYNSQVGVPLSVWLINKNNTLGIFESGISLPNEMAQLQKIILPQIGMVSFIGSAHAEGFINIEEKIREKLLLFINSTTLIYCVDDALLNREVQHFVAFKNKKLQLFTWGKSSTASLHITAITLLSNETLIACVYKNTAFSYTIPFNDEASIHNSITCTATLLVLNKPIAFIIEKMQQLKAVAMRMELKQGINNTFIINDGYSVDEHSLNISLNFLAQQKQYNKHTLILSDVLQTGKQEEDLYKNIASILVTKNIQTLIGIGTQISTYGYLFSTIPHSFFYESTAEFIQNIRLHNFKEEIILLKGARVFGFEKISKLLEQKTHETRLEINLNALRQNLKLYKSLLLPTTKIMVMVKAFGYGSGSAEVANILQQEGVAYLAVAYVDEGVALRNAGITLPIMVLNTEVASFENLLKYKIEPEVYSFKLLEDLLHFFKLKNVKDYHVHIKIDTGMKRLGFDEADIDQLCQILTTNNYVKVASIFSHLAGSDVANFDAFTTEQQIKFTNAAQKIEHAIGYTCVKHIANTAAIYRHNSMQMDMVRLGIGLYGIDASKEIQNQLQQVSTLKTTIAQIKHLQKGETIGYSRKGVAQQDLKTATVRIGYADGYSRILGNGKGKMSINGQLAPVIGNVCMDMTMLDITGIQAQEGDEVIVFGQNPTITEVADWANTISYEILTNISQRVKRVYFEE